MRWELALIAQLSAVHLLAAGEKTERFDRDPGWEGPNHRSDHFEPRTIRQDFGFTPTRRAGGIAPGELGGRITPAAEPAFYARPIERRTLEHRLKASGTLAVGEGGAHFLLGYFNSGTLNEWRTPNTLALRIQGRGDVFYAYVEYATGRWRAGADSPTPFARVVNPASGRQEPKGFAARGASHSWSFEYDPEANGGAGSITATIDDERSVCHLDPGHKADGAIFDRFGVLGVMKSADSPGEFWVDDLSLDGQPEPLDSDLGWEGRGNRIEFQSTNVRPRFDFGFSPTHFAGGIVAGEFGGSTFRGDCREEARLASCGDRVQPLTLDRPIRARGKLSLRRAVSDSTTLLGFYHSERSIRVNPSQASGWPESFFGLAIEGPSREGFFVYPAYRTEGDRQSQAKSPNLPRIEPDGRPHDWTLEYDPTAAEGCGRITMTLDGEARATLDLGPGDRTPGLTFDRFGLVSTWIDGNGQTVYFDDLTYTSSQAD